MLYPKMGVLAFCAAQVIMISKNWMVNFLPRYRLQIPIFINNNII